MFALLTTSTPRLIALVLLSLPPLFLKCCPPPPPPTTTTTTSTSLSRIEGCYDSISTIKLDSPGRYRFDSSGQGDLFVDFAHAGKLVDFNLLIDINLNLVSGNAKVLNTQGDRLFIQLNGNSMGPDANQVITFSGKMKPFGGTGDLEGTKGSGDFNGSVNIATGEGSICVDGHLFKSTQTTTMTPQGPGTVSIIVLGLLLAGWTSLLLFRRKRGLQS